MPAISGLVLSCCGRANNPASAAVADAAPPSTTDPRQLAPEPELVWHPSLLAYSVYEPQSMAAPAAPSASRLATNTASPMKSEQQRQQQQNCRACLQGQPQALQILQHSTLGRHAGIDDSAGCSSLRRYRKRSESPMFNPYLRPRSCTSLEDIRVWSQRKTSALLMAAAAAAAAAAASSATSAGDADSGTAVSHSVSCSDDNNYSIDSYCSSSGGSGDGGVGVLGDGSSRSPNEIELSGLSES